MRQHFNSNSNCAHAWAHGHQEAGQGSHFFFNRKSIYSYGTNFPIAFLHGHKVYFTLKKYSKTTAKHKSIVLSALSHKQIIYVQQVPIAATDLTDDNWINANMDHWIDRIKVSLTELQEYPRRKKLLVNIEQHRQHLLGFIESLEIPLDPALSRLIHDPHIDGFNEYIRKEEKRRNKLQSASFTKALARWRRGSGKTINFSSSASKTQNTYLRYNGTTECIETSKGIKIPEAIAKHFWKYIQQSLPAGCGDCSYSILDFKVNEITSRHIQVGCHTITMKEITKIVRFLKW